MPATLSPEIQSATMPPMARLAYPDVIPVPESVRFPVELEPPKGFQPEDPASWPDVEGRLEWVGGRLLFMPPCGDVQQGVAVSVAVVLGTWGEAHPEFFVGGNEAGMLLQGDVRGAGGAVWRFEDLGRLTGGYVRIPPLLAVEVAGREEGEPELRTKATWYFAHGVGVVWIVLPHSREVVVLTMEGHDSRHGSGSTLPPIDALPGLAPPVDRFFSQLR